MDGKRQLPEDMEYPQAPPPPYVEPYPQPQAPVQDQPYPQPQAPVQNQPQGYGNYNVPSGAYQPQSYQAQAYPPQNSYPSTMYVAAPQQPQEYVPDNMVISIISIFCCLILGIIATVKASDSRDALRRGDIEGAKSSSRTAKKLAIAGIVIGCIVCALVVIMQIVFFAILNNVEQDDY